PVRVERVDEPFACVVDDLSRAVAAALDIRGHVAAGVHLQPSAVRFPAEGGFAIRMGLDSELVRRSAGQDWPGVAAVVELRQFDRQPGQDWHYLYLELRAAKVLGILHETGVQRASTDAIGPHTAP